MNLKKTIPSLLVIILVVLAFKLLTIGINKPFWGHHDWLGVVYSNVARNYLRYGYLETKFGQVANYDVQTPNKFSYITHYPPLLPIIMSFSFRVFGVSEAAARLSIIFFSLMMIYFIYQIGKEIHSQLMGIFAAASSLFLPIFLYFGKVTVHDTIIPPISVFGFWAYIKYIKTKNRKYFQILVISLIIGGLVNWSAFYLAAALVFHNFIYKNQKEIRYRVWALVPLSVVLFLVHLTHLKIIGVKSTSAFSNFLERANPYLTQNQFGFTLSKYIIQELRYIKVYYTLPLVLGSVFFILLYLYSIKKRKVSLAMSLILTLAIYGLFQLVVFTQLSYIHDFMIYYLLPFMVLSFSYSVFYVFKKLKQKAIFPLILIALLTFILFSQLKYTQALLATNVNKRGYDVARVINTNTNSGQISLITSNSYKEFQEVFIGYYADREVDYQETLPIDFDKKFNLIIRPKDHDPLSLESKKLLDNTYPKYEDDKFIWYKVN